jgi:hypothetical protein
MGTFKKMTVPPWARLVGRGRLRRERGRLDQRQRGGAGLRRLVRVTNKNRIGLTQIVSQVQASGGDFQFKLQRLARVAQFGPIL